VYDWEEYNENTRKDYKGWCFYIMIMYFHKPEPKIKPKDASATEASSSSSDDEESDDDRKKTYD
jgi:hypothetical protein